MSKTNKPKNLRGETLEKAVREVVAAMQLDTEVTPAQMNMAEVARRVGCSRTVLYQKNYKRFIAEASQKKLESYQYEKKLSRCNYFYLLCKTGTKSTAISRLESPNYGKASISMLKKLVQALGCELQIRLVPKHE